jgi:hypothetical protein
MSQKIAGIIGVGGMGQTIGRRLGNRLLVLPDPAEMSDPNWEQTFPLRRSATRAGSAHCLRNTARGLPPTSSPG